MSLFSPIPPIDDARVVAAIAAAEERTAGEIRVFISSGRAKEPVLAAERQFERLNMTQTAARNGVLIFLAPASHTFAVVGDKGVHDKCGEAFWQELAASMNAHFKRADFTQGLVLGIERAGALLA
ncbi:MAG: TPM domain-containing protein, partial [Opitutaceae bacterium]